MVIAPGASNNITSDHPLSDGPESAWSTFFKDNEFLLQIDKDVRRLCPDISFFQQATEFPCDEIVKSNGARRLHTRVTPSTLSSANVERKGLGLTKVNPQNEFVDCVSIVKKRGVVEIMNFYKYLISWLNLRFSDSVHQTYSLTKNKKTWTKLNDSKWVPIVIWKPQHFRQHNVACQAIHSKGNFSLFWILFQSHVFAN